MPASERHPRVTEHGAVALPASLTVADAERLARRLRPSWDDRFGNGGAPETASRSARSRRASDVAVALPARSQGVPVPGRSARPGRATATETASEWDDLPVGGVGGANPKLKLWIGVGMAALAILVVAVWALSGPDTKSAPAIGNPPIDPPAPAGVPPRAAQTAAATALQASPEPRTAEEAPLPPSKAEDVPSRARPVERTATLEVPAPKRGTASGSVKTKTRADKAAEKAKVEEAPPPPAPKPNEGGTIVRDTPF